ncbi:MAG: ATP-binding protein [Chloroflexi bacterium]|nr:ATP-binding protein [Chloroflexota bacterium]
MSTPANPYNPLQPVEEFSLFYGREDALAFFRQNLVGAHHRHALVLLGWRGIGKSSLLRQLSHQIDERYRLCAINLGELDLPRIDVLLAALVDNILLTLEDAEVSTYRLPEWPDLEGEALVDWFFGDYLGVALAALRQRHLLLVLDDAHLLLNDPGREPVAGEAVEGTSASVTGRDFLARLAAVIGAQDRLDVICALDATFEDRALQIDLLNNPALHFRLAELPLGEAEFLVRESFEVVTEFEDGVVEEILVQAGGHPFLLHSICRLLYRRSEERAHAGPVTTHDLAAVSDAVYEQIDDVYRPLWADSNQNERLTLTGLVHLSRREPGRAVALDRLHTWLASSGSTITTTQLAAALRSLDYKGLVRPDGDVYSLPATLLSTWVEANSGIAAGAAPVSRAEMRLVPIIGVIVVVVLIAVLGVASFSGLFDTGDESSDSDLATRELDFTVPAPDEPLTLTPGTPVLPADDDDVSLDE